MKEKKRISEKRAEGKEQIEASQAKVATRQVSSTAKKAEKKTIKAEKKAEKESARDERKKRISEKRAEGKEQIEASQAKVATRQVSSTAKKAEKETIKAEKKAKKERKKRKQASSSSSGGKGKREWRRTGRRLLGGGMTRRQALKKASVNPIGSIGLPLGRFKFESMSRMWKQYTYDGIEMKTSHKNGVVPEGGVPIQRLSTCDNMIASKVDMIERNYYGVEIQGMNMDGVKCKLAFYVRLGICSREDCCCSHGLVRYETTVKELHGNKVQEQCAGWTLAASSMAAIFFGNWKVESQTVVQSRCMANDQNTTKVMSCKYYGGGGGGSAGGSEPGL